MDKDIEAMILADAIQTAIETEKENIMLRRVACLFAGAVLALTVLLVVR